MNQHTDIDLLPGGKWLNRLLLALTLSGLAINLLLLLRRFTSDGITGCSGGTCDEMLSPPWSEVVGIPITLLGALVYGAVLVSLLSKARPLLTPLCGLIVGAAGWFLFVQAVLLGHYCNWCLAGHGIGVILAMLTLWRQYVDDPTTSVKATAGFATVCAAGGIAFLQFFGPGAVPYQAVGSDSDYAKGLDESASSGIYARGDGRKVVFAKGRRTYDLNAMPHLGPADAKFVFVEYFDYRAPSCRVMQEFLNELLAKHPKDVCLIVLPVPLERTCNSLMSPADAQFPGSCKLSQLALAVWRKKPEAFAEFHQFLLAGADPSEARSAALELIAKPELEAALQDSWIREVIEANIKDCAALSATNKKLPKLLISETGLIHGLPPGKAEFILEIERLIGR